MSVGRRHHPRHHLRSDHRPLQRRLLWGGSSRRGGEMGDICAVPRSDLAAFTLVKCKNHAERCAGPVVRERERERED